MEHKVIISADTYFTKERNKLEWNLLFFVNSFLLGVGLAMDAFSVSVVNGFNEVKMSKGKMCVIAGVFAGFQALMPMIGWVCVHTIVEHFKNFQKVVPWIALILLIYIGGELLKEGLKHEEEKVTAARLGVVTLLLQGVATSIDALSVGFTISEYGLIMALVCAVIIAAVTFIICMVGLIIGKIVGTKYSNKAEMLGGIILIGIGLEIFITGVF